MTNPKHTDASSMTEAEALDEAARAAGWLDGWSGKDAGPFARLFGSDSIRAHAKTIMELAELMASGKMAAAAMREAIAELRTRADRIAALKAENERLREALELADAALRGANMNMNVVERKVRAALKEIDNGDR